MNHDVEKDDNLGNSGVAPTIEAMSEADVDEININVSSPNVIEKRVNESVNIILEGREKMLDDLLNDESFITSGRTR